MIVGTHFGLFMPALRPNWEKLDVNEPELQVRARRRIDLLNLKKFMEDAGLVLGTPFSLPNTDYQWRAYCTREAWGHALHLMAMEIDYTKFKDTPQKYHGDRKLTDAYGKIWNATFTSFPTGSVYDKPSRKTSRAASPRVDEVVYRTEQREWRMKGSDPVQLARLMREIDNATADVVLPTDEELNEIHVDVSQTWMTDECFVRGGPTERNGHLDHSNCDHGSTASARRKCRKRFYRDN